MSGIVSFMSGLPEFNWDLFIQVFTDLQDSTTTERLESLRQFLVSITKEIDSINRKRDAMGQKASNIDALLPLLDNYLRQNPDDVEVDLFRNILTTWRSSLKSEITESRPDEKLDRKYSIERKREALLQLQKVLGVLNDSLPEVQRLRKEAVDGKHVVSPGSVKATCNG